LLNHTKESLHSSIVFFKNQPPRNTQKRINDELQGAIACNGIGQSDYQDINLSMKSQY